MRTTPKIKIRLNQIWKNRKSSFQVLITGKTNVSHKWKAKVLTDKPDKFNGSHTFSQYTLWRKFECIKE